MLKILFVFSHTEIDDMIRKSTNLLLTRTLGSCLSSLIKRRGLTLLQVSLQASGWLFVHVQLNIVKITVHVTPPKQTNKIIILY